MKHFQFTFNLACNTGLSDRENIEHVSEPTTSIDRANEVVGARRIKPACKLNIISVYQQL